jgi:hypothetical protein
MLCARRGELESAEDLLRDCLAFSRLGCRAHQQAGVALDVTLLLAQLARLCALRGRVPQAADAWRESLVWAETQLAEEEPAMRALRREAQSQLALIELALS